MSIEIDFEVTRELIPCFDARQGYRKGFQAARTSIQKASYIHIV